MKEIAIELKSVKKQFGKSVAVNGIDLTINRGELVTFLGPSGCGKTTTLRLIAGLELPSSGVVKIDGQDVSQLAASDRNVGMVFQSYALFPHMTVLDNVVYGPVTRGEKKSDAVVRAHEVLSLIGLDGLSDRYPSELSGGQQQRVAVARAIVQQPDVLLFDEPLSNVDAKLRRKVRNEIRQLQQRFGITAVYVTHDQEEALAVSDKVVVMKNGIIEQVGTPEELYTEPSSRFVADFIGDANLITGKVDNGFFKAGQWKLKLLTEHLGMATVSIRPELISFLDDHTKGVDGKICSATYLGSRVEYEVETSFGEILISRPANEVRKCADDIVKLNIAPESVILVA
ncbi:ABC transporter ATP-binding protein [Photobacterium makurazakiensis]|uniref:ABC transporter ATP-binding protein n=1 Tax=Photobacterium makurazakiensis TaxID=2910234 RepID=UPI003D0DE7BA